MGTALPCGRGSPLWELPSPVGTALPCGSGSPLWELPPLWERPSPVGAPSSTWKSKLRHPKHTQTRGTRSAKVMDPPRSPLATQIPAWEAGPGLSRVPNLWVRATPEQGRAPRLRNSTAPGLTREAWPVRFFLLAQSFYYLIR